MACANVYLDFSAATPFPPKIARFGQRGVGSQRMGSERDSEKTPMTNLFSALQRSFGIGRKLGPNSKIIKSRSAILSVIKAWQCIGTSQPGSRQTGINMQAILAATLQRRVNWLPTQTFGVVSTNNLQTSPGSETKSVTSGALGCTAYIRQQETVEGWTCSTCERATPGLSAETCDR